MPGRRHIARTPDRIVRLDRYYIVKPHSISTYSTIVSFSCPFECLVVLRASLSSFLISSLLRLDRSLQLRDADHACCAHQNGGGGGGNEHGDKNGSWSAHICMSGLAICFKVRSLCWTNPALLVCTFQSLFCQECFFISVVFTEARCRRRRVRSEWSAVRSGQRFRSVVVVQVEHLAAPRQGAAAGQRRRPAHGVGNLFVATPRVHRGPFQAGEHRLHVFVDDDGRIPLERVGRARLWASQRRRSGAAQENGACISETSEIIRGAVILFCYSFLKRFISWPPRSTALCCSASR